MLSPNKFVGFVGMPPKSSREQCIALWTIMYWQKTMTKYATKRMIWYCLTIERWSTVAHRHKKSSAIGCCLYCFWIQDSHCGQCDWKKTINQCISLYLFYSFPILSRRRRRKSERKKLNSSIFTHSFIILCCSHQSSKWLAQRNPTRTKSLGIPSWIGVFFTVTTKVNT